MSQQNKTFLEIADRIGCRLCRDAVWDANRCSWLGWSMEPVNNQWTTVYRSFAADLYGGTSGIALFLAELYQFTADPQQRKTLEGAINQSLSALANLQGTARIGFFSGVSGIGYALVRIGKILKHEGLIARGLAELSSLSEFDPDPRLLDVIGGSAGAIPALLAVGQEFRRDALTKIAMKHGDHLLSMASRGDNGWSWDTMHVPNQQHLTGHSHGVAGIVTALLELYRSTGENHYREGAEEGLRYERGLFSAEHSNWPDLRIMNPNTPQTDTAYNMAWCHGAPGVGLSRLRCYDLLNGDSIILGEIEAALKTTAGVLSTPWQPGWGNYSLCHGASGNAELLLLAGRQLGRADLTQIAEKVGWEGYQHYYLTDSPWPCGIVGAGETPNLLLGIAGIGHFYLRLYDSATVPSILIIMPDAKNEIR